MTTKQNPFLAGMRATGKGAFETQEDRKEYEAGFMAISDITDLLASLDNYVHGNSKHSTDQAARLMAEIDRAWSSIKAALASEVTP